MSVEYDVSRGTTWPLEVSLVEGEAVISKRRGIGFTVFFILMAMVLFLAGTFLYFWLQKEVIIEVDGGKLVHKTFKKTVEEVLNEARIELKEKDLVEPDLKAPIEDGVSIRIIRAIPVTVQVDGKLLTVETPPATVEKVLSQIGVTLGAQDKVNPGLDKIVEAGEKIVVTRVTTKLVTEEIEIPFKVLKRQDSSLERGIRKIIRRGKKGRARQVFRVTLEDGREVSRELVRTDVLEKPVDQVVAYGTLQIASRGEHSFRFTKALWVTATAYTHTGNPTKTGIYPRVGTVAVDPKVIPLGTRLYVDGYGFAEAQDIGSAIKGNRIDVFLETREEALRWGRRKVKVYLLE
ncbi:3D domain-containing protein [Calderihabitans maritimus]|uniref:Uncharacterized protein conserved in bacteria n=1 Tax=Calderihabitans maritimus TaxID=1246530 RepID=A0A1Z5HQ35_9FIRM|nr:3D domain-containing protein [Calderihabitans maritimus]GAW91624.1 uncharacterized protein conserved in bacteria [Calderihabitans maritimus]